MRTADLITKKLTEAFTPQSLKVLDESHQHEGHAGHRPGGQTHFRVYIVSEAFKGKTRLERHRMINQLLSAELAGEVHSPSMLPRRAKAVFRLWPPVSSPTAECARP
jgi:BolA protein